MLGVAEVDQRIEAGHRLEDDVAAVAAVAAVGSAEFDELLAPERDRAGAAGAGADENLGLVEEMHVGAAVRRCGRRGEPATLLVSACDPLWTLAVTQSSAGLYGLCFLETVGSSPVTASARRGPKKCFAGLDAECCGGCMPRRRAWM